MGRKRVNQYEGSCHYCRETVDAGDGTFWYFGRRCYVAHLGCMDGRRAEIKRLKCEAKGQGYGKEWKAFETNLRQFNGLGRSDTIPEAAFRGEVSKPVEEPPDFAAELREPTPQVPALDGMTPLGVEAMRAFDRDGV